MRCSLKAEFFRPLEKIPDIIIELTLVFLNCQHIVGPGLHDLLRYLPLTSHGVDGHDASVERQESQQLGNGGDLVGLPLHLDLAQRHAVGRSPRAYQVNGLLAPGPVVGAAHRLTVNGHHFTLGQSGHLLGPPHKQLWNCSGSRRENTSPKVSWDGMPLGSSKKLLNHSSLLRPNISICTHESAPQIVAQMATAMMSSSLCRLVRSIRGSFGVLQGRKPTDNRCTFRFHHDIPPSLHFLLLLLTSLYTILKL